MEAMEQLDDHELARRLVAGERPAGEVLIGRHYRGTYWTLYQLTNRRDLAADLTQETFRRAWAALDGFRAEASFKSWLHRIAYNTMLNHARASREVEALDEGRPSADRGPAERARRRQRGEALRSAVTRLPERQRSAVAARYWGELTVAEIASDEGVSEVAVRKRLRKALRSLRHLLEEAERTPRLVRSEGEPS